MQNGGLEVAGSEFTLANVPPGRSTVMVNNWPPNSYVKSIQYGGQELTAQGADLTSGEALTVVLGTDVAQVSGRVMDAAGKPPARDSVSLVSSAEQPQQFRNTRLADRNGEFRFPGVRPGEYKVYAWESGNSSPLANFDSLQKFQAKAKSVKVEAGGSAVVDVPLITADETAAASPPPSGMVEFPHAKGSVEGQIVHAKTGAPVQNALVRLGGPPSGRATGVTGFIGGVGGISGGIAGPSSGLNNGITAQTDEQGHFVFRDVEPGTYPLFAERQGFVNFQYGLRRDMTADPLVVGEGQALGGVTLKMEPQSVVAGKVTDEHGEPLLGAGVSLLRRDTRYNGAGFALAAQSNTNPLGEFRLPGVAAGSYILAIRPARAFPGQGPATEPLPTQADMHYPVTYYPASFDPAAAKPIVVESGAEVSGIDMTLHATAVYQIRGKVEGMPPAAPPPPNAPAGLNRSPVLVTLFSRSTPTPFSANSVTVRPDGSFAVADVLPGSYLLAAVSQVPGRVSAAALPLEIKDQHLDGVTLALKPGREVKATVRFAERAAARLMGMSVSLRGAYNSLPRASGQVLNDDSSVTFRDLLPIPYQVDAVRLPQNCGCYLKAVQYGGRDLPAGGADLTTGEVLEIVLGSNAGVVEGKVLDREGKPLAGATVALAPVDAAPAKLLTGATDRDGKYFFDGNPPGTYKLYSWADLDPAAAEEPGYLRQFDVNARSVKLAPLDHQNVTLVAMPVK
jgi:hypothetical protein